MAKVYAPNKSYTGVSAGVAFVQGVGQVPDDNEHLIGWFKRHGYRVELEDEESGEDLPVIDDWKKDQVIELYRERIGEPEEGMKKSEMIAALKAGGFAQE